MNAIRTLDGLQKQLREEIGVRIESLSRGSCADFAAYQQLVGVLSGLRIAEQLLTALLESVNDDDDPPP
jgi:hypothetical protein